MRRPPNPFTPEIERILVAAPRKRFAAKSLSATTLLGGPADDYGFFFAN
ncbi:MAG: hypothetical protein WBO23_04875 [Burkholderiales bacterium]